MLGGEGDAKARRSLGDGRWSYGGDKEAELAEPRGGREGPLVAAKENGNDRSWAVRDPRIERLVQAAPMRTKAGPAGLALGTAGEAERGAGGSGDGGRRGGGEDERPSAVDEVLAQRGGAGGEPTRGTEGLAERTDEDVRGDAGICAQPSALGSANAERVSLIDEENGIVLVRQGGEVREGSGIAVHAEERLGDENAPAKLAGASEGTGRGARIAMGEDLDGGLGEPATVDEAGVVRRIRNDEVGRACEGRHHAEVGLVPRREEEG